MSGRHHLRLISSYSERYAYCNNGGVICLNIFFLLYLQNIQLNQQLNQKQLQKGQIKCTFFAGLKFCWFKIIELCLCKQFALPFAQFLVSNQIKMFNLFSFLTYVLLWYGI